MTKDQIRLNLKEQRDRLPLQEQIELCDKINERLLLTQAFQECDMIFTYLSFRSEVSTQEIIQQALVKGKKIFLPRVDKKEMDFYEIHNLEGLILSHYGILEPPKDETTCYRERSIQLKAAAVNTVIENIAIEKALNEINEKEITTKEKTNPEEKVSLLHSEFIENSKKRTWLNNQYQRLMLLPGLAFDHKGNRIGYGAGYYDRYLTRFSEAHFYKIALAYDFQVIDEIPSNLYDVKADAILTPTRLILCKKSIETT